MNVLDLGELIVAKCFEKLPKARSGNTDYETKSRECNGSRSPWPATNPWFKGSVTRLGDLFDLKRTKNDLRHSNLLEYSLIIGSV